MERRSERDDGCDGDGGTQKKQDRGPTFRTFCFHPVSIATLRPPYFFFTITYDLSVTHPSITFRETSHVNSNTVIGIFQPKNGPTEVDDDYRRPA